MSAIIHERLEKYSPKTIEEEENALKEILQEIILYGLANEGFFENALFQGGTALRILYKLPRFSEDLDFILKEPNPHFNWKPFLKAIEDVCKQYGIEPEVLQTNRMDNHIKKMILKDNSIVNLLNLSFHHHSGRKLKIKLEIDVNPPFGSISEIKFLDFPLAYKIEAQDLCSNFAGKSHALLCRKYIKGRDWYDFLWYVSRETSLNFILLTNSINQQGPWAKQDIQITTDWYLNALTEKIKTIDWEKTAADVSPFLIERERKTLELWGIPFFLDRVEKLRGTLYKFFSSPTIENLIKFRGSLNTSEKKSIRKFLDYYQHFFINTGHKINGFNVNHEKIGNTEINIFIDGKENPYRILIGRAILIDKTLEKVLLKASTPEACKILLESDFIKIGSETSFV